MIITKNETNSTLTIDMPNDNKQQYGLYAVYLDDVEKGNTLPITFPVGTGVFTVKVVLSNTVNSYKEEQCTYMDKTLLCRVVGYAKETLKRPDNVPYWYFLLEQGTKDIADCGCFCTNLRTIYNDIICHLDAFENKEPCNCTTL